MTDAAPAPPAVRLRPDVAGLVFRTYQGEADHAGMIEVNSAAHRHDGIDWLPTVEDLALQMAHPVNENPRRDLLIAELDGRIVAYGRCSWAIRDGEYGYQTECEVHPDVRRRGIGTALLGNLQDRLRLIATEHPDDVPRSFRAFAFDGQDGAAELLKADGYAPVRFFAEMTRPLGERIPEASLAPGLELRPVEERDYRRIFDAEAEAFRDHWGNRDWTDGDYARTFESHELDTTLWRVAWDGDEVAGVVETFIYRLENETLGVSRGWLEKISVRRPWRRRGVATALIASAIGGLRERGIEEAALAVDADNPTGAFGLYEGLGFRVVSRAKVFARPFD